MGTDPGDGETSGTTRARGLAHVAAVACVITALNAAKPLVTDDAGLARYAHHIARHPTDPYGFEFFWYERPEPANHVLNPPVLPYWTALAVAAFGERPFAWKLWLFPFHLLFAGALYALLGRFSPRIAVPLLWMAGLSPGILIGTNLAMDVPALALALAALVVFIRACEGTGARGAIAAGLLAGLALQTKYTAIVPLLAVAAASLFLRRIRLGLLALGAASAVFAGWELWIASRYGESHFLYALSGHQTHGRDPVKPPLLWTLGFLSLLGPTTCVTGLLGLTGLGASRLRLFALGGLAVVALGSVPFLPAMELAELSGNLPRLDARQPELYAYLALGLLVAAVYAVAVRRLWKGTPVDRFLLVWVLLELAAVFVVSPFLAARRLIGLSIVLLLTLGRLAGTLSRVTTIALVAAGALHGLLFFVSDLTDARARRSVHAALPSALAQMGADRSRETVWFIGHWEFQYYAEAAGLVPVVPDVSFLARGDWLIIPLGVDRQPFHLPPQTVIGPADFEAFNVWPWSTLPAFYSGPVPLRRQPETQLQILIYRIDAGFLARSSGTDAPLPARTDGD